MADQDLKLPMHSRGWLALALAGIAACMAGSVWATANWVGAPDRHVALMGNAPAADVHALSRADDDAMLARALRATALTPALARRDPIVTRTIADVESPAAAGRAGHRRAHTRRGHHAQRAQQHYTSAPAVASVDPSALR